MDSNILQLIYCLAGFKPVKHGAARYNKYKCRCPICRHAVKLARRKERALKITEKYSDE